MHSKQCKVVMNSNFALILLLILLFHYSPISHSKTQATIQEVSIEPSEQKIIQAQKIPLAHIGYILMDPENGNIHSKHNADKTFIPASTTKILTSLFALETLGGDFQFETEIGYEGKIENGVLTGNLILRGSGDPFLMGSHLFDFALEIKNRGIHKVKGKFLFDDSYLQKEPIIDANGLKDQTYNPGFSALNLNFNRIVLWRNGSNNKPNEIELLPIPPIETFRVEKKEGRFLAGEKFSLDKSEKEEVWRAPPLSKHTLRQFLPVRNSSLYTAETLRVHAKNLGIEIPAAESGQRSIKTKFIHIHKSKPLVQLAEDSLEYSNNLLSEMLLLRAARKLTNKTLSLPESAQKMMEWFSEKIPDKNWSKINFVNGSGLSPDNQITPELMAKILSFAQNKKYNGRNFISLLSTSGWKGWIENRLHDPEHSLRVWAKTGTLDFVITLTGYILSSQNKKLAFVIYINDPTKRNLLNNGKNTSALRAEAKQWRPRAQRTQDELLKLWMSQN